MSRNSNVAPGGFIEGYAADVAVSMVFGLGYYLFNSMKRKKDKSDSWVDTKEGFKEAKGKLEGALARWQYAKTIEEYHELIKNDYDGESDPFSIINLMNKQGVLPTIETYNALLLNCIDDDEKSKLLTEEMLDPMGPVEPNVYTLNILIKGLGLKYRDLIKDNSDDSTRKSIHKKFDEELLKLIENFEGRQVYMDVFSQNAILNCLIEQCRMEEAWAQFTNMKSHSNFKPDIYTYTSLLKGIKRSNDLNESWLEKAFFLMEEAKSMFELDESFFNALLDACVKFNRIDKAEALFKDMCMRKEGRKRRAVTEFAYSIMIKAYGKIFKMDKAKEMFHELKEYKQKKYALSCNPKIGDNLENTSQYSQETECPHPSTVSYGAILNAAVRCKDLNYAESIVEEMTVNKIPKSLYIFATMVNGYRKTRNFNRAIELFDYLVEKVKSLKSKEPITKPVKVPTGFNFNQLEKDFELNLVFFNSVLDCCVDGTKFDKMEEIFNCFESYNLKPDLVTYSIMIKGYAKNNQVTKVKEIYDQLRGDHKLDEVIYNTILDCYCKHNDETNLLKVFYDMKRNNVSMSVFTYGILIKLYCNLMDSKKAFEVFDECVKSGLKPSVVIYHMLIKLQLKCEFLDRAMTLFRNMIVNEIKPDTRIYELIIKATAESNRSGEAAEFLLNATREGIKLEKFLYKYVIDSNAATIEYCHLLMEAANKNGIVLDRSIVSQIDYLIKNFPKKNQQYRPQNGFRNDNSIYENSGYQYKPVTTSHNQGQINAYPGEYNRSQYQSKNQAYPQQHNINSNNKLQRNLTQRGPRKYEEEKSIYS
jgi:pentatricopeptide repeat protein